MIDYLKIHNSDEIDFNRLKLDEENVKIYPNSQKNYYR